MMAKVGINQLIDGTCHCIIMIEMKEIVSIPIPKKLAKQGDLVIIPKKEYERLLAGQDDFDTLTAADRRAIKRAEKNFREGKSMTLDELKKRLGIARGR